MCFGNAGSPSYPPSPSSSMDVTTIPCSCLPNCWKTRKSWSIRQLGGCCAKWASDSSQLSSNSFKIITRKSLEQPYVTPFRKCSRASGRTICWESGDRFYVVIYCYNIVIKIWEIRSVANRVTRRPLSWRNLKRKSFRISKLLML